MQPLSSEDLLKLKAGDVVYLGRKPPSKVTVKAVGRKYVTFSNSREKVNLSTGRTHNPDYSQWESYVYRSVEDIEAYNQYCREVDEARNYIRHSLYKLKAPQLFKVFNLMKEEIEKGA